MWNIFDEIAFVLTLIFIFSIFLSVLALGLFIGHLLF